VDGRNNFETKELSEFSGILASGKSQKAGFSETASPFWKNFTSKDGVLESREGKKRLNAAAYANKISSLVSYTSRNDDHFLVFSVRASDDTVVTMDGSLESIDLDTLLA